MQAIAEDALHGVLTRFRDSGVRDDLIEQKKNGELNVHPPDEIFAKWDHATSNIEFGVPQPPAHGRFARASEGRNGEHSIQVWEGTEGRLCVGLVYGEHQPLVQIRIEDVSPFMSLVQFRERYLDPSCGILANMLVKWWREKQ